MTHRRQCCTPKPDQPDADLCMCVNLPLDKKIVKNQDWATGQSWAVSRRAARLRACF